jgi:hypothetical protein
MRWLTVRRKDDIFRADGPHFIFRRFDWRRGRGAGGLRQTARQRHEGMSLQPLDVGAHVFHNNAAAGLAAAHAFKSMPSSRATFALTAVVNRAQLF